MIKKVTIKNIPLLTRILLALFLIFTIAVVIIGLDDVPGFFLGIAAATTITVELTRRWRSIRKFIFLAVGTFFIALTISGLYMELAEPLALHIGGPGALESSGWQIFSVILSDIMLLFGTGCIVVGWCGALVLSIIKLRRWWYKKRATNSENLTPSTP